MDRAGLVKAVVEKLTMPAPEVERVLLAAWNDIKSEVEAGRRGEWPALAVWWKYTTKATTRRNPKTQVRVAVPAKEAIAWRPARRFTLEVRKQRRAGEVITFPERIWRGRAQALRIGAAADCEAVRVQAIMAAAADAVIVEVAMARAVSVERFGTLEARRGLAVRRKVVRPGGARALLTVGARSVPAFWPAPEFVGVAVGAGSQK